MSQRGRGRARATNRTQLHSPRQYSKERDHKAEKERSRSPAQQSDDEELIPDGEVKLSQEPANHLDTNTQEKTSDNNPVEQSEGDKSTR